MNAEVKLIIETTDFGTIVENTFEGISDDAVCYWHNDSKQYYLIEPRDRIVYTLDNEGVQIKEEPFEDYFPSC